MTRNEFMTRLEHELRRRNVADAADVVEEYEQHFAFKLADGYSEEEIAAKLGTPEELAAQFEAAPETAKKRPAALTWLWLGWADLFFGLFSILLVSFGLVLAACVVSFGAAGVCLIGNLRTLPYIMLPEMPYWCGAVLGLSLLALCVLAVVGCIWFFAFLRQLWRAYGRFHQNALTPSHGGAVLPELPIAPQFAPKKKRQLRTTALIALLLFAVCFVLAYVVCALSAGNVQFWHVWGWFQN